MRVFKPNDIEGMADAIEKLILNEDERERIGRKNYAAAVGLPMQDIVEWYKMHFNKLSKKSKTEKTTELSVAYRAASTANY